MLAILFAALLAQNEAAPAPAVAPPSAPPAKAAKPAKPKLVCHVNEVTGSRLGAERVCKTAEEWERIRRDSRDRMDDQLRHGLQISLPQNVTNG
jgi:hypothetical protein